MAWKKGPLPAETYGWGAVVPAGHEGSGFYFADFCGDRVVVQDGGSPPRTLAPDQVRWYDNSLTLPPCDPDRGGGAPQGEGGASC